MMHTYVEVCSIYIACRIYTDYTLTQNENYTFIKGFTMHEKKTPVPPDAGSGIEPFIEMLNFISWGVSL